MIKKIDISELKTGMYICGLEKRESGRALFFMNNILIKNDEDAGRFSNNGYAAAYISVEDPATAITGPADKVETQDALKDSIFNEVSEKIFEQGRGPEERGAGFNNSGCEEGAFGGLLKGVEEAEDIKEGNLLEMGAPAIAGTINEPSGEETEDTSFYTELNEAKRIRSEAEACVRDFMISVRMGKEVEYEKVNETVEEMVGSIFRNQDALLSLVRLKSFDNYTFTHSINVCALSLALGRSLDLGKEELHDLGVGAILHDIGKMLVPAGILNKSGGLTEAEFREIRKHPSLGFEIVSKTRDIKEESGYVILCHHEKYDGTGYQNNLMGADIHLFARIASVADVYDAMTSDRVYQKGMLPEEALKKMYTMRGKSFEPELVERLVKCIGIYPVGALVELNTGEMAVVTAQHRTQTLQPAVSIVFDKNKEPLMTPLEADLRDETGRWIVASRDPSAYGVDIEGFFDNA